MDRMQPLHLGVISFAHGHIHAYLEAIKDLPDADVVVGWDADRARGLTQCAHYGLEFEPDLDALLRRDDLAAVVITSPTNQHADHAVAAAQAGKAIFLQKPMALTLRDCDAIIDAVNRHAVPFSMCYQMRADPVNKAIKALIDEGAVGNVAIVRRRHGINSLLNPQYARPGNWHIDPVQNLGMFMDDASHAADWFYWMLGRPTSVIAEIDNIVTHAAPDDNGVAVFRFAHKELGILLNSSTMRAAEATTEIYGDQGVIIQNYGDAPSSFLPRPRHAVALKMYRAGGTDWEPLDFPADTPHAERIKAVPRALIDYLLGRSGPLATAEDGRVCVEMVLAAYQAAREGRRIIFTDSGTA
jgi:predicted dehydrogenase